MKILEFESGDIQHPFFKNKSKCLVLNDVYYRLVGDRAEVYYENKRLYGFINRDYKNADVLYWGREKEVDLYFGEIQPQLSVNEEIDSLFLLYDDYEWQYAHFVMDSFPKLWYWIKLQETEHIKIGINNLIECPCKTVDMTDKVKYNTSFIYEYIDLYLKRYNLNYKDNVKLLDRNKCYFIKRLIIPIPYQSVDTGLYPYRSWEMLDILKRDIPISMEYENIYISRKDVSSKKWMHYRVLLNENDIINKLNEVGFREIQLMNYSVEEKIQIFKSAKKIIQTVGSNCYNLRFIEPKTWCCILYHPEYYCWSDDLHRIVNYKNGVYKEYIDSCKVVDNSNSYYPDEYNTMKKKIDSPWKFTDIDNLVKETII